MSSYAQLLKTQRDWRYEHFEKVQRRIRMLRMSAAGLHGWGDAYQIIDGRKVYLMRKAHNQLVANWLAVVSGGFLDDSPGAARVVLAGLISSGTAGTSQIAYITFLRAVANSMLGTDTATATNKFFWKLVSAIPHAPPTVTTSVARAGNTLVQGVTYNPITALIATFTYGAGATSGNPTIGELAFCGPPARLGDAQMQTRMAAADGAFTAFTINSALPLTVHYSFSV
jgi:hypothetical protein